MRVVLDTNVILSGILFGGKPREILEAAVSGTLKMYISEAIVTELKGVLQRPKFGLSSQTVEAIVAELSSIAEWVVPQNHVEIIKDDISDNDVLDCALEANADYIVSGDEHLLRLVRCGKIPIVNPDALLRLQEG
jgi:putative PIN family toxin of toxin-antitoxin system